MLHCDTECLTLFRVFSCEYLKKHIYSCFFILLFWMHKQQVKQSLKNIARTHNYEA